MPRAAKDRPQGQMWGPSSGVAWVPDGAPEGNLRMQLYADIDALLLERFEQLTKHLNGWMGRQEQVYKSMPLLALPSRPGLAGGQVAVKQPTDWYAGLDRLASRNSEFGANSVSVLREGSVAFTDAGSVTSSTDFQNRPRKSRKSNKSSVSSASGKDRTETIMTIHGGINPPAPRAQIREPSQKSEDTPPTEISTCSSEHYDKKRPQFTKTFSEQERQRRQFASSVGNANANKVRQSVEEQQRRLEALRLSGNRCALCRYKLRLLTTSQTFDLVFCCLIITNAGFIGLQVQYNAAKQTETTPIEFYSCQCIYTFCFFTELMLRIVAEGISFFSTSESFYWNWFDFIVVALSVIEVCIQVVTVGEASDETLRNLSIIRIFRIIRIVRARAPAFRNVA